MRRPVHTGYRLYRFARMTCGFANASFHMPSNLCLLNQRDGALDHLDVALVQLRGHVLADGFLHALAVHAIGKLCQRAQKHRIGNGAAQKLGGQTVRVDGQQARIVQRISRVHQADAAWLQLALPAGRQQRSVQVDHEIRLRNGASVTDLHRIDLGERAHGRAASLGAERGERKRVPLAVKRRRRAQKPSGGEGPLPAAAMPKHFYHVKPFPVLDTVPSYARLLPGSRRARRRPAKRRKGDEHARPLQGRKTRVS